MTTATLISQLLSLETGKRPKGGAATAGIPSLGGEHIAADGQLKLATMRYVPKDFFNDLHKGRIQAGDILIVKDGATTGRVGMIEQSFPFPEAAVNEHVFIARPDPAKLVSLFLYYYLRSPVGNAQIMSDFRGAAQGGISREIGQKVRIPAIKLEQQQRIADQLSRADGIVRLRREAQKKTTELIPAIFLDMFGDPAKNPKNLPEMSCGDLIAEFRYGTSQKSGEEGHPTLRIPNVIGNQLNPSDMKFCDVSKVEAARLQLRDGDILFVRTNGNPDYVGRSAVFDSATISRAGFDASNVLYASYLIRARVVVERLRPLYLQALLSSFEGRKRMREKCRTSAGQYNINIDGLKSIRVPLPTISEQDKFVAHAREISALQDAQERATHMATDAFDSLLSKTFQRSEITTYG